MKASRKTNDNKRAKLREQAKALEDGALLSQLLSFDLSDRDREAFENMHAKVKSGDLFSILSPRQREWAENAYVKHKAAALEDEPLNLVSNGQVPRGSAQTYWWEKNRPLKPPGVRS